MTTISIFSDESYLPDGTRPVILLSPFWHDPSLTPESGYYDYATNPKAAKKLFTMTTLADADLAILPGTWAMVRGYNRKPAYRRQSRILKRFKEYADLVKSAEKPLVIFFEGDFSYEPISIEYDAVFRTAEFRTRRKTNSFVYPPFCSDLITQYFSGKIDIREKTVRPVISFCGRADKPPRWLGQRFYRWACTRGGPAIPPVHWGYMLRGMVLDELVRNGKINTSIIIRDYTFHWSEKWFRGYDAERTEFVKNIVQSDYVVCTRGVGNFSCRFYEALCCGRIPVLVDTDNVLPFEFAIDWQRYIVRISPEDHGHIADRILAFHERLSEKEFIELQKGCRRLWKEWLSAPGFHSKFHLHFKEKGLNIFSRSNHQL